MEKVLLGMSGGVDSSASALVLKEQGYKVTGLYLHMTGDRSETGRKLDKVREKLHIDVLEINVRQSFQEIISSFKNAYLSGLTPNPCIMCNPLVKFRYLLNEADRLGICKIATGHYARIAERKGCFFIQRGIDIVKDQSYMLYRLENTTLNRILFPLGDMYKKDIVKLAEGEFGSEISSQKESQDICFLQKKGLQKFLRENAPQQLQKGLIVDHKGNVLGKHNGIFSYTIGQRKGLGLPDGPWFVYDIDPKANVVRVGKSSETYSDVIFCREPVWHGDPEKHEPLEGQHRYNARPFRLNISFKTEDTFRVKCNEPVSAPAPGQALVIYWGDLVLGGGTIAKPDKKE